MNESEQRELDTKQQHDAFMKAGGYTQDENGKWQKIVKVKVTRPEREERIVEVKVSKMEQPPMVLNIEEKLAPHEEHLKNLAHGFIKLVNLDQVFDGQEIDLYYTTCKASTLLSVLTGYPPDLAYDLTEDAVEEIKEEIKND